MTTHWVKEKIPTLKHIKKAETHFCYKPHPCQLGNPQLLLLASPRDVEDLGHTFGAPMFKADIQRMNPQVNYF